jgi:DNA polymerase-3 subunit beta
MHITLPRAALAKALDTATRIVERRTTIPILSNVLLRATGDTLVLSATDLDMEATIDIAGVDVKTPGALTVPANTLRDVAHKIASEQITLDAADGKMQVRGGRAKFSLLTLPDTDWPDLARGETAYHFSLPAATLNRALEKTDFAISTEETRYYLNGVYMHAIEVAGQAMLRAVATDGHRLARFETQAPKGGEAMPGVIIPRKAVKELRAITNGFAGDIEIAGDGSKINFTAGPTRLLTKLIDGSFPDYNRVIPTQNDNKARFARTELAEAAERVATVAGERGRAIKLEFDEGKLTLSVVNPDVGNASEELEGDYDTGQIQIGFNAGYLRELLGVFAGDQVEIELNDGNSPTIFRSAADADLVVVLMPMRVS